MYLFPTDFSPKDYTVVNEEKTFLDIFRIFEFQIIYLTPKMFTYLDPWNMDMCEPKEMYYSGNVVIFRPIKLLL